MGFLALGLGLGVMGVCRGSSFVVRIEAMDLGYKGPSNDSLRLIMIFSGWNELGSRSGTCVKLPCPMPAVRPWGVGATLRSLCYGE